jgi:hypothetical protein
VQIITLFSVVFVDISKYKAIWATLPICDNKWLLFLHSPITLKCYNLLIKIFWQSLSEKCSSSKQHSFPVLKTIHWETTEKEGKQKKIIWLGWWYKCRSAYTCLGESSSYMLAVKMASFQMLC